MTPDDLPIGNMKYSFKGHVQAHGFPGDLIISSTSVNDLVTSIRLLLHAGITPTAASAPVCPVHQRPMKLSRKPGAFSCSAKVGDDDCQENAASSCARAPHHPVS